MGCWGRKTRTTMAMNRIAMTISVQRGVVGNESMPNILAKLWVRAITPIWFEQPNCELETIVDTNN